MFNVLDGLYYVTPTLYNAWRYYMETDQNDQDFLDVLNRVYKEPSDAIIKGINFEDAITNLSQSGKTEIDLGENEFKIALKISEIVKGGFFQQKLKLQISPNIVLYGKADVIKGPKIYDIKRVSNYEAGKYSTSIQHEAYMLITRISDFDYLICDGNNFYVESYWFPDMRDLEKIVKSKIDEMIDFIINNDKFYFSYKENWKWVGKTI